MLRVWRLPKYFLQVHLFNKQENCIFILVFVEIPFFMSFLVLCLYGICFSLTFFFLLKNGLQTFLKTFIYVHLWNIFGLLRNTPDILFLKWKNICDKKIAA